VLAVSLHQISLSERGKYLNFPIELILGLNNAKNGNRWVVVLVKHLVITLILSVLSISVLKLFY
jgi:hypothetical protein